MNLTIINIMDNCVHYVMIKLRFSIYMRRKASIGLSFAAFLAG